MSLTPEEVRAYISDQARNNHLLDDEEFTDFEISLAMDLAVDEFNMMPPLSQQHRNTFPFKSLLMTGTLWKMFLGKSALLARNNFNYSDGGVQVPLEERFPLYQSLAAMFEASFKSSSRDAKDAMNLASGWGEVRSDEAYFPRW